MELFDMCCKIKTHTLPFVLNPDGEWDTFDPHYQTILDNAWQEVKFLNETGDQLNNAIRTIPNDTGGIYTFIIKPNIISDIHLYIAYIGRVQSTTTQNLRKRIREYFRDTRPLVMLMREMWGKYLYVRYLPLTDNDYIKGLEEELIRVILPPCNDQYPGVYNLAKTAAFV